MKFKKVFEECTGQADVQGLPTKVGKIVRRPIKNPITRVKISKVKKK